MKTYHIPNTDLNVTRIAYGCMKIGGTWDRKPLTDDVRARAQAVVASALEHGINFFDHADIYCYGKSEQVFADVLKELRVNRTDLILESKCGIRMENDPEPGQPARFDYSYEHIIESVEGSLRRLQTDYLDILLLHRPDALVEPEEVARAFDELQQSGKVRYFGVSNHYPAQIALLKKAVKQPLVVNQLELNLLHAELIELGLFVNNKNRPYPAGEGTIEYCRLNNILIQAWAPVANGRLVNPRRNASSNIKAAAKRIADLAEAKNTTKDAIVLAWLLRHPAPIQPILGTTQAQRVSESVPADDVQLTREEWYGLLQAARGGPLP